MGWWELLTDRGRALSSIVVRFDNGELRVSAYCLSPGEQPAVLLDHLKNRAYCITDDDLCRRILAAHGYEVGSTQDRADHPLDG